MKCRLAIAAATVIVFCVLPHNVRADAVKHEWFGTWAMNHDGHVGTLTIGDTKADCISPLWCDMSIKYVDADGHTITGTINKIDDHVQHMAFTLNFPGNNQKFD